MSLKYNLGPSGRERTSQHRSEYGKKGGRPRFNRMPVVDALPIWKRPGTKEEVLAEINRISRKLGYKEYKHKTAYHYLGPRSDLRAKPDEE